MELSFNDYTISTVYGSVDNTLRGEIIDFWSRNNAIGNPLETERRVQEVVCIARNPQGELAGLSTVYPGKLNGDNNYFFYRMFIQPTDRIPNMMRIITRTTRDYLNSAEIQNKPQGIAIVTENPKLMRKGMKKMFTEIGYHYLGKGPKGNDIWTFDFS
ncbi:hypothetical protein BOW53_12660 [Solemya pervernicosa gill symbiont]|uniref:N-acetyltransferase domain-containing protein n=2 Tax=Gammaproteobacteria incertae sedis TaxID=118884 RepID=A0A1T2L224_9GAMM|nr:hypothetical protein [Candidatus Reidiella endopervernicosa]OOZ39147.1 hypothetical protein BOW53_12660 [Solemya pervernicosa gill symbiont]QKQ28030.1 hypothetical protein HUE57_18370 [Candidatus Reidiella endopervernicosa]